MELLLFLLVNGLIWGCLYALMAISFAVIFNTTGIFHFAHGVTFAVGVYATYFCMGLGLNIVPAVLIATVVCALFGLGLELVLYRPLRKRGTSHMVVLAASLGMLFVVQNLIAILFKTDQIFLAPSLGRQTYHFGKIIISGLQMGVVAVSLALFVALIAYLRFTKMGMAIRAVTDNQEIAEVAGVDPGKVHLAVFVIGSALAAPAGVMFALMANFNPYAGGNAVLMAAVATIVGGMGSVVGTLPAALLLGVAENVGVWQIPGSWKPAIVFSIIILFMILRPTGFFGTKMTKTGV